jgi:hypothetical protein
MYCVRPQTVFLFALLALVPLAERLSFITEQLAAHTNPTVRPLVRLARVRA